MDYLPKELHVASAVSLLVCCSFLRGEVLGFLPTLDSFNAESRLAGLLINISKATALGCSLPSAAAFVSGFTLGTRESFLAMESHVVLWFVAVSSGGFSNLSA